MKHVLVLMLAITCFAADEEKKDWSNTTDLSLVQSGGNSEGTTYGFKNLYKRKFGKGNLNFNFAGVMVETTTISRFATGTVDDFDIVEEKDTEKTAERWDLKLRYDQAFTKRAFWYMGADWHQNQFSGIDNRYTVNAGLGHTWFKADRKMLKTNYGVNYISKGLVLPDSETETFVGYSLGYEYMRKLSDNTTFKQHFSNIGSFEDGKEYFLDLQSSVTVNINNKMALKAGLDILYNNKPELTNIPLLDSTETVLAPLKKRDHAITISLVINM